MTRPNIVFILIDDLGWRDLSCYGSEFYETPNIDTLYRDGMHFTDAYAACPICSPTRASILSGKYPATVGVTNFIDWNGNGHPAKGKLVDVSYFRELPLTEKSLGRALREGGYATWHVGKWHLGGRPCYPDRHGFDVNAGGYEVGMLRGYFSPWGIPTLDEPAETGVHLTDFLTDRAVQLIENHRGEHRPFFLNLWYYHVHTPIQAKEAKIGKYREKAKRLGLDKMKALEVGDFFPCEHKKHLRIVRRLIQSDPVYAAMIETLDENIGKILKALEHTGQDKNTIVVFTSDNGGVATSEGSPTTNAPLAEGKGWMYEGGTREPLIVRWPGVVRPGSVATEPVTSPDFYPTLLEAVGLPLLPEQHVDGESFLPLLKGEDFSRGRPLFWHFPHYGNQGGTQGCSIRKGDFKRIEFFEDGHAELYNRRDDRSEELDLVGREPEKARELLADLRKWREEVTALIPKPNPDFKPWRESDLGYIAE